MKRCACLSNSPTRHTTVVVPSPVISSCAAAALAISTAVGDWICISVSNTLPSLVSLMLPAPSTSIFSVPLGPKLVSRTDCKPSADVTLTFKAASLLNDSAFGFNNCNDMLLLYLYYNLLLLTASTPLTFTFSTHCTHTLLYIILSVFRSFLTRITTTNTSPSENFATKAKLP
ncbi:hypothetical protein NG271_450 [Saccharomyces cerevisiae synthetic construct]|uniref:Putative uncharacterized membrane protein YDR187C n=1 Tax=Saccharomyces cerevisiae (strain ATCC 204508 / S288c) TaxID=559292 RepID=YD87C_YEAST|nr:RecName: Full=Putative uncharacterized membrane protein YDR187C [Saccharomyces cerevisiae S288C]AHX39263.1 hypothetical protein YDR187C [Saccharomyces cerevisiae]WNF20006.1 hypothetical protein NG271_450 [Saccharomyces cerevisiae synthetic construct]